MKTWFRVPEYLPKDCVPDYLTVGKWYDCSDLDDGGGSILQIMDGSAICSLRGRIIKVVFQWK